MSTRALVVTVTRNINGSLTVSAIVSGYRVARTYYGYGKRDAMRMFRAEVRNA